MDELRQEIAARANELERQGFGPLTHTGPLPPEIVERKKRVEAAVKELEAEVDRLSATGGILADVDRGLVEFLSTKDGRDILLSWQLGEPVVTYYHPLDQPGRRPL